MALSFVVEDGTGVSGATSYVALADADQYVENRPHHEHSAVWNAAADSSKHGALIAATAYLDAMYNFKGTKADGDNELSWPRMSAYDREGYAILETEIPTALKDACVELAMRAISEDLAPDLDQPIESAKVGPLAVAFDVNSRQYKDFRFVDKILRGLIYSSVSREVVRG